MTASGFIIALNVLKKLIPNNNSNSNFRFYDVYKKISTICVNFLGYMDT